MADAKTRKQRLRERRQHAGLMPAPSPRPWEPEFIRLWERGATQAAIAQALGCPVGTVKSRAHRLQQQGKIQARPRGGDEPHRAPEAHPPGQTPERPPSTVDRRRVHVTPSTVDRPPNEIGAVVSAALQPLLARLEALEAAVEGRPAGAEPSTVHRPPIQRLPSPPDTSTVHPATADAEAWELRQVKHSVRWTIYVPRAMQDEIKRRAAAAGRTPSLLVQQALRRWLAEEER